YPKRLPDLFSAKPLVLTGRYTTPGKATIRLRGKVAGHSVVRKIEVEFPGFEPEHDVLATLWARTKIADLMSHDYNGIQQGNPKSEIRQAITQLGLDYRLMTQFTSFVAVEELIITEGGQPRRVEVPVELPDGVSYEGIFGREDQQVAGFRNRAMRPAAKMSQSFLGGVVAQEAYSSPPVMADSLEEDRSSRRFNEPESKLEASLQTLVDKKKAGKALSSDESAKVQNGKILVQVWLADTKEETLSQLTKLGFTSVAQPKSGHLVIGYIPVEQLEAFAKLKIVRYVTLQRSAA
ncbi:MAG: hypothetical protein OEY57_17865, partial [Nitrospirota bacterium]|nr:hypothetical protein [Nitrospirota bacterium]